MMKARSVESQNLLAESSQPFEPMDEEDEVNEVYKQSKSKKSQMQNHEEVKKNEKDWPEKDFRNEVKITDAYVVFQEELIEMVSDLVSTSEASMGIMNIEKNWIEISPADTKPIDSAPYQADPKAREFVKYEVDTMTSEGISQPTQK